ncbi:MAG: Na+/H+ antiporter NhaA [Rhodospirillaceae bacterium]|nr:Na+/H+ antiporter NhaA [Rhodospirillaceae bacterium]
MSSKPISAITAFIKGEATAGLLLMAAAVLALIIANTSLAPLYMTALDFHVGPMSVLHIINDGLMAVFFLLVGLEIKREVVGGELSTRAKAALPVLAAAGGMAGPAVVYILLNEGPELRGWAIPAATDIAFALGILALLGRRAPQSLKIFLTALAVIDDLGAILIIALFYTADLSFMALGAAAVCIVVLFTLNRFKVRRIEIYLLVGLILWVAVLQSGVHATMAGVITALAIPADGDDPPLTTLEYQLHPWVTYLILPLFAFANAGVVLGDVSPDTLSHPVTLGIVLGLFIGKQVGVVVIAYLARALGWVRLPEGATPAQFYGTALLTGVGFTMSLFIGALAFPDAAHATEVKIGVLAGSLLSGIAGYLVLYFSGKRRVENA